MSFEERFVLPGDELRLDDSRYLVGPGIHTFAPTLEQFERGLQPPPPIASKAGMFCAARQRAFVDNEQIRYIPGVSDPVVGVVSGRIGDGFKVDVGCAQPAYLPSTSFEGAVSRKTRPQLPERSLVYAWIVNCEASEIEISCVNPRTGKAEKYGPLEGGAVLNLPLKQTRRLLDPKADLPKVEILGKTFPFDLAVGLNGRVWLNASSPELILELLNLTRKLKTLSSDALKQEISRVASKF